MEKLRQMLEAVEDETRRRKEALLQQLEAEKLKKTLAIEVNATTALPVPGVGLVRSVGNQVLFPHRSGHTHKRTCPYETA